ncbi:copper chaperone PCu(A)C [Nocardioides sp. GY 10113]|uniref:copper chaperone PCu(A)C n=1 Tax=Nocardioides sp. GY 10113 TaxID=2569761 RepID=UPI0010A8EB56|nr:copper chaperone PCu(A)C [Nocardioides sp. GY 10113]TIC86783.1 copper chaperone PCu(A)C [Nocardioides sp. GY 10113]
MMKKHLPAAVLAALLVPGLAACGSDDAPEGDATDTASATVAAGVAADSLTVADPWVKAVDGGMSGAFGVLTNDSDADITLVSADTDVAGMVELHETVQNDDGSMAMQPKEDGFVVPAGGEHVLQPGGDHIMLMGLSGALEAGTTVTVTLTFDDGSTQEVVATVKPFTGADETYQGGDHSSDDISDGMSDDMGDDMSDGMGHDMGGEG